MVSKRKRSQSIDTATEATPQGHTHALLNNPWSIDPAQTTKHEEAQEGSAILDQVLRFMDLTKLQHKQSDETIPVVDALLLFVQADQARGAALVSSQDVAKLLLPWATKQLVYQATRDHAEPEKVQLYWKVLSTCLEHLRTRTSADDSTVLSQTLNQSVLNKLVLFAAQSSHETPGVDDYATISYTHMVDHLYRPTLDLAAKSLLVQTCQIETAGAISASTLSLLKRLQRNANPKKTFQLFAEIPVLEAMAKLVGGGHVTNQIQELLWDVFFNPTHHLDGFRSLQMDVSTETPTDHPTIDRTFRCYQQDFMETLVQVVKANQMDVIQMVPLLLEGFISQTQAWDRDHKRDRKTGRKKSVSETASLQFKFWVQLARPLLEHLQDDQLVVATSLRQTVQLVMKHDLYLPSFEDKDQKHFLFLQHMATCLMEPSSSATLRGESLRMMDILIKLNHHVVHDRLSQFISHMLTLTSNIDGSSGMLPVVMLTIVNTYHQLRQLDYFFEAIVATVSESKAPDAMASLNLMLHHPAVADKLSLSIASCPHGQIRQLFRTLDSWIVQATSMTERPDDGQVAVVAKLFGVLVRHVTVDQHAASDMFQLCTSTLVGSVKLLLGHTTTFAIRKHGLELCGWTLDLKTRCAFWLGNNDDQGAEESASCDSSFLPLLNKAVASATDEGGFDNESFGSIISELQFLACYRIQQLHSLIHKQKQRGLVGSTNESLEAAGDFEEDARRLVHFVFVSLSPATDLTTSLTQNGWKLLSKFVHLWVHYAKPIHITAFVNWIISTIIVETEDIASELLRQNVDVAQMVVTALLRDASFIEIDEIASLIGRVGIAQLADTYTALLSKNPANPEEVNVVMDGVRLTCSVESDIWETAPTDAISSIMRSVERFSIACDWATHIKGRVKTANKAHRLLEFLNSMHGRLARIEDLRILFESILRLHTLNCKILMNLSSTQNTKTVALTDILVDVLASLRGVASKLLMEDQDQRQIKFELISGLSFEVIQSIVLNPKLKGAYSDNTCELQHKTNGLLECSIAWLTTDHGDDGMTVIVELVEPLINEAKDNLLLLHPIITSLLKLDPTLIESVRLCFGSIVKVFNEAVRRAGVQMTAADDVFLTDLLRLAATQRDANFREIEKLVQVAAEDGNNIRSTEERAYLVACLVAAGSGNDLIEMCEQLYENVTTGEHSFGLLDAVFGTLVRQEDDDECGEISDLLERLEAFPPNKTWIVSHIFCLLVKNVDDKGVREAAFAKFARRYFFRGLLLLQRPSDLQDPKQLGILQQGELLMTELTKHKDIINIKERDIALFLSQICLLLGPASATADPIPTEVFTTCYNLVSTLLQRFPKQLYTCAPSLFSTLRLLLKHTLYGLVGEAEVESRAQMLSRLCEFIMPHRDVFKKHVLVLLLEYIQALKAEITPFRKRVLMPAIFSLLSTLSVFEQQQLNALTDATGKILFSNVYSSYQKGQYKGQY